MSALTIFVQRNNWFRAVMGRTHGRELSERAELKALENGVCDVILYYTYGPQLCKFKRLHACNVYRNARLRVLMKLFRLRKISSLMEHAVCKCGAEGVIGNDSMRK